MSSIDDENAADPLAMVMEAAGPGDEDDKVDPPSGSLPPAVRVLQTRSRLAQAMRDLPALSNLLVIEDNQRDSDRLVSTLRSLLGYAVRIRQCGTLGTALDAIQADQPDLVFLDDRLGPVDTAETSVPFLRAARCTAMIIVISGHVDRQRRATLLKLDVGEVIAKDDLDSTSIGQALVEAQKRRSPPRG